MNTDRFDVSAKFRNDADPMANTPQQMWLMLRALLIERFNLTAHRETKELPIYALVLARGDGRLGPQLRHSDLDCDALAAARREAPPPRPAPGERLDAFQIWALLGP